MTEPIQLVPYDAGWPAMFRSERVRLQDLLAPWLAGPVEHVGSTAVPGMVAKPVIDIMAGVLDLEHARPAIPALRGLDYRYAPYRPDQMHWFCKPDPERRTHHLHLIPFESRLWHERLAFRDALRADGSLATAYAQLKRELAVRYRHDRDAYTEAKTAFVQEVVNRARVCRRRKSE